MRNFMSYDRRWLDEPHIGDHVGRAVWALGEILSTAWTPALVDPTQRLLDTLVGGLPGPTRCAPTRMSCSVSRGSTGSPRRPAHDAARTRLDRLVDRFRSDASEGWLWFEHALAYDNARLPRR